MIIILNNEIITDESIKSQIDKIYKKYDIITYLKEISKYVSVSSSHIDYDGYIYIDSWEHNTCIIKNGKIIWEDCKISEMNKLNHNEDNSYNWDNHKQLRSLFMLDIPDIDYEKYKEYLNICENVIPIINLRKIIMEYI